MLQIKQKSLIKKLMGCFLLIFAMFITVPASAAESFELHLLDVRQGLSVLVEAAGITVCVNVTGDADQAVKDYLAGTLSYNTQAHACGGHHH